MITAINPFLDDLSNIKDAEIENKIQDLSKKYWISKNPDVRMQIANLLEIYKQELGVRRSKAWEQQYQKRNKDLDDLIQVN
jgi:hypothetical protein